MTHDLAGIDINVIGVILMVGGVVGLIFGLILRQRRVGPTRSDDPEF